VNNENLGTCGLQNGTCAVNFTCCPAGLNLWYCAPSCPSTTSSSSQISVAFSSQRNSSSLPSCGLASAPQCNGTCVSSQNRCCYNAATNGCYCNCSASSTSSSSIPPIQRCELHTIQGMIVQCCSNVGSFGPYSNCTNYQNNFHQLCESGDLTCESVDIDCNDGGGHAVNQIQRSDGNWCLVEPQGYVYDQSCYEDPSHIPHELVCDVMDKDSGCDCEVARRSPDPLPVNTNPSLCARKQNTDRSQCNACCNQRMQYFIDPENQADQNEVARWLNDCSSTCNNWYP
jgi:hypothetical protein